MSFAFPHFNEYVYDEPISFGRMVLISDHFLDSVHDLEIRGWLVSVLQDHRLLYGRWRSEHMQVCELLRAAWPNLTTNPTEAWQQTVTEFLWKEKHSRLLRSEHSIIEFAWRIREQGIAVLTYEDLRTLRRLYFSVVAIRVSDPKNAARAGIFAQFLLCAGLARTTQRALHFTLVTPR